jgi:hypothetical protein
MKLNIKLGEAKRAIGIPDFKHNELLTAMALKLAIDRTFPIVKSFTSN